MARREETAPVIAGDGINAAFSGASLLFFVGFALPLGALAWLVAGSLLSASAGLTLAHAGSFSPEVFHRAAASALKFNVFVLIAIALALLHRRFTDKPTELGLFQRHPIAITSLLMLAALGLDLAVLGSNPSSSAAHTTTTVVLANIDYFAIISALLIVQLLWRWYAGLRPWVLASPYRTGMWTGIFALAGAGGLAIPVTGLHRTALAELRADVDLAAIAASSGLKDFQQRVLCVATEEAIESGAVSTEPPQCARLLHRGSAPNAAPPLRGGGPSAGGDGKNPFAACAEELEPALQPQRERLVSPRISRDDAYDAVLEALLVTCSREPLPNDVVAYFIRTSWNYAASGWKRSRRTTACAEPIEPEPTPETCRAARNVYTDQWELRELWEQAMCTLPATDRIIAETRLREDLSFRQIGTAIGISELQAKDSFNNAVRKFRKRLRACVPQ